MSLRSKCHLLLGFLNILKGWLESKSSYQVPQTVLPGFPRHVAELIELTSTSPIAYWDSAVTHRLRVSALQNLYFGAPHFFSLTDRWQGRSEKHFDLRVRRPESLVWIWCDCFGRVTASSLSLSVLICKMGLHRHISQDCTSLGNENVCVCSVQQGSHWPQVAGEHLKYSQCDWAPKLSLYFILIDWKLNLNNHTELAAAVFIAMLPLLCRPSGARQSFSPGVLGGQGRTGTQLCSWQNHLWHVFWLLLLSTKFCQAWRLCRLSLVPPPHHGLPHMTNGARSGAFTWVPLPLGARAALQKLWFIHCKSGSLAALWCDLQGAVPVCPGP